MSIAASAPLSTLLFAVVATFAVAGCGVSVNFDGDATRRVENERVAVGDLRALDVSTDNGTVEIRSGGASDEITIQSVFEESDDGDADASIEVEGDRLVVRGECDDGWWQECSVGFVVTVPSSFDTYISTDNGRVELIGISGDVSVETDNGRIEATELRSTSVNAHTDNGRIRLAFDAAPTTASVKTDNGAIDIVLPQADEVAYDVDASSGNGRVDIGVRTDPASEHRITAESDNGAIDVDYSSADDAP